MYLSCLKCKHIKVPAKPISTNSRAAPSPLSALKSVESFMLCLSLVFLPLHAYPSDQISHGAPAMRSIMNFPLK